MRKRAGPSDRRQRQAPGDASKGTKKRNAQTDMTPPLRLQSEAGNQVVGHLYSTAQRAEAVTSVAPVQRWIPPGLTSQMVELMLLIGEVRQLAASEGGIAAADLTDAMSGDHPFEAVATAVHRQARTVAQTAQADRSAARTLAARQILGLAKHHVLVRDVVRAIAMHETGERAIESRMHTSAGVRASLASQVQGTIAWSISALLQLDNATLNNRFNLTRAELLNAQDRAVRVRHLWNAVHASPSGTTSAGLLSNPTNQAHLAAAGLTPTELGTMLEFRELRLEVEAERATRQTQLGALSDQDLFNRAVPADRRNVGVANVAALSNAARRNRLIRRTAAREAAQDVAASSGRPAALNIRQTDLFAYARGNWAEDKAAWMRVAVSRDPAGARIEQAATADQGLELGRARIDRLVRNYQQGNPNASDEDVCRHAASQHNPGAGAPYVNRVLRHFRQIHGTP